MSAMENSKNEDTYFSVLEHPFFWGIMRVLDVIFLILEEKTDIKRKLKTEHVERN